MLNAIITKLNRLFRTPETVSNLVWVRDLGIYFIYFFFFFWGGGGGADN